MRIHPEFYIKGFVNVSNIEFREKRFYDKMYSKRRFADIPCNFFTKRFGMYVIADKGENMKKKGILFGITALMAVSMTACGGSGSAEQSIAGGQQTNAASEENTSSYAAGAENINDHDEYDDEYDDDGYDDDDYYDDDEEEENTAYRLQAEAIFAKTDQMLTALKEGDIDTLIELGDPDDIMVKSLSRVSDFETARQLLRTIYAELYWEVTEEDVEWLEKQLQEWAEHGEDAWGEEMDLYMNALAYRWMINASSSALLYFEPGDVVPGKFIPETEEQAWEILQTVLDNRPLQLMPGLTISVPDAEGNFYFLYEEDYLFSAAKLDELGYWSEDQMIQQYVSELMDVLEDYKIGDTEAKYKENDALFVQVVQYAVDKDFEALTDLLEQEMENDYRDKYGAYDELNDAQKAFVDSVVEQAVVTWVDYSWARNDGEEYRDGDIQISFPCIGETDEQVAAFIEKYQVMDSGSTFYLGSNIGSLESSLLHKYYFCIRYAMNNIE